MALTQIIAFVIYAFYSAIYAYRRLTLPGMSKEVKHIFIKKHITYVGAFIFVWTVALTHAYFQMFYSSQDLDKIKPEFNPEARKAQYAYIDSWLLRFSIYTSIATG